MSPEYKGFQRRDRTDGISGYEEVISTKMGFVEQDGSDVRVKRVRVFKANGEQVRSYLEDPMGVTFKDMPDIEDDPDFSHTQEQLVKP